MKGGKSRAFLANVDWMSVGTNLNGTLMMKLGMLARPVAMDGKPGTPAHPVAMDGMLGMHGIRMMDIRITPIMA